MSMSKTLHDELCTSYAAMALYDGDVSVNGCNSRQCLADPLATLVWCTVWLNYPAVSYKVVLWSKSLLLCIA